MPLAALALLAGIALLTLCAELAGELAIEQEQHSVAIGAYFFAMGQWRGLQRDEDVTRVKKILSHLGP